MSIKQANVMLSYPIDEAITLLEGKLSGAKTSLEGCQEDMDFLREQVTVRTCPSRLRVRSNF
jgi:hypothetical protein